ncbi:M48 family peptidase [Photobacterium gaetbulicola]|uniref:Putative beta-barrel assembly-enhancing protease n=1 Tax=Photobacterium gaetbulicola Gung47 TaxID=658445 RepID=A0A0C5WMZ8_9GAMM|nr:M48 family metalloprotease [Photobacterium gaetbulicola]AJR07692.1 Zn-dependent protease [Photobacterium gaetbulicola Gung47]PSU02415.1 M48 family peptidase [Photobacterium gaetbulicola]
MFRFAKAPAYLLISALLGTSVAAPANDLSSLPDIGTAAAATLSIEKEMEYGDAYMRMIRASMPVISDPLLSEYIQDLGHRLVANANDVRTPFNFFMIQNRDINAFAFFGGHVAIHSGLFLHANTESELASVVAHEIAHVTQRHLARSMEDQARKSPATLAALIGSMMLAIASPEAGIAAIHATTAASAQGQINYTRSNEKEADRIGIATLSKSGFDVQAMPRFFGRLADQYRYVSTPPPMLLTHPLPESRITDSRSRANQFPARQVQTSQRYQLARARIVARYAGIDNNAALDWLERQARRGNAVMQDAVNYGKALVYIDSEQYEKAHALLDPLLAKEPNNRFYIDSATDLDLHQKHYERAIARLEAALKANPNNKVLRLNLANALQEADRSNESIPILTRYTYDNPNDPNGWHLLAQAQAANGRRDAELAARAELLALRGAWEKAIQLYIQASQIVEVNSLDQARYDARIDQLRLARQRVANL